VKKRCWWARGNTWGVEKYISGGDKVGGFKAGVVVDVLAVAGVF
jgi:hypothetical protein